MSVVVDPAHLRLPIMLRFVIALSLALTTPAAAHQVPNITTEALFRRDGGFDLKISLDPRVFLSDQPTSLPPVPAEWFTSQSDAEVAETWTHAKSYLADNFHLRFGENETPLPEPAFQAMDGATNQPLSPETAEVHILATMEGRLPDTTAETLAFEIAFGQNANTSLILLNSIDAKPERRPQVLFPGETSRPFAIPAPVPGSTTVAAAVTPATTSETIPPTSTNEEPSVTSDADTASEPAPSLLEREKQHEEFIARSRWWVLGGAILIGLIMKRILFPKEK